MSRFRLPSWRRDRRYHDAAEALADAVEDWLYAYDDDPSRQQLRKAAQRAWFHYVEIADHKPPTEETR